MLEDSETSRNIEKVQGSYTELVKESPKSIRRLSEENLTYVLEPNRSKWVSRGQNLNPVEPYRIETNSEGFRDEKFSTENSSEKKIMVIGDSFTFGWGVNRSDRFTDLMEKQLESDGEKVETYNLGVPGLGMRDYRLKLQKYGPRYRPDLIVVAFSRNDIFNVKLGKEIYNRAEQMAPADVEDRGEWAREKNLELRRNYKTNTRLKKTNLSRNMNEMLYSSRRLDANIIFFSIRPDRGLEDFSENWANKRNANYIEAPQKIDSMPSSRYTLSRNDSHYNKLGHRLLADKLAEKIRNLNYSR